jgi:RNA polymerase sigma-70 factor (ECF subfamily)
MNTPFDLDTAIDAALARGRAAWPEISVAADRFAAHVRALGVGAAMLGKYGADLYFAWACTERDPGALRLFHSRVLPTIDPHVARLGMWGAHLDELHQDLSVYLLADRRPRLAGYAGRGPLLGWLRTVAARRALRMRQAGSSQRRRLDRLGPGEWDGSGWIGPEGAAMRRRFGPEVQRALQECLAELPPAWKVLLRMHCLEGRHVDEIAREHGVHRATVFRWFASIRSAVSAGLCARLTPRLPAAEMTALIGDLRDDLQIDVDDFLGERAA